MPIYEYEPASPEKSCPHCVTGFEQLQSIRSPALLSCPECGNPVRKCISAPAVGASQSGFDDRAKSAGFSKLKKTGKGEYEKQY